jgi:hypothetical protein
MSARVHKWWLLKVIPYWIDSGESQWYGLRSFCQIGAARTRVVFLSREGLDESTR